jgi:adenine/guanine phosphoribosyltransferase-like PRPP-binding protein
MVVTLNKESGLENRLRAAIQATKIDPKNAVIDAVVALSALGNVTAEVLAHISDEAAWSFLYEVMQIRKQWKVHPDVMIQRDSVELQILEQATPAGRA